MFDLSIPKIEGYTMYDQSDTDQTLIVAIRKSDYVSYNKLFVRYYNRLCQYVYGMIQDKSDSEDIVQELFLQLWNGRKKIAVTENVSAYLYKMAKNRTLNHIRSAANYKKLLDSQESQSGYYEEGQLEVDEFRIALYDCIDKLPDRSKQILILHRVQGMKQKEIADKLNISVKTIKNQIWTSLQRLRKCLVLKTMYS